MRVKAYRIEYDTDGEEVHGLPKVLHFNIEDPDFNPENDLADLISDHTGWCVFSFKYKILK